MNAVALLLGYYVRLLLPHFCDLGLVFVASRPYFAIECKFLCRNVTPLQTPLHLSVLTRQANICRTLILAGAQVDSIDRNGDTPLHIACKLADDSCIRALTEGISPLELKRGLVPHSTARAQQLPQNLELRNFEGELLVLSRGADCKT